MPSRRGSRRNGHRSTSAATGAEAEFAFVANGWIIYFHPLFLDQLDRLVETAAAERAKRSADAPEGPNTKLAAAIRLLVTREIPQDPSRPRYRHGGTLDASLKHWFSAKFGNGRFRLFFRYHSASRVIVFAWVNDAESLRTYGSRTDAYAVFRGMLGTGNPPDDWEALVRASSAPDVLRRARKLLAESE